MINKKYVVMLGAFFACASFSPVMLAAPDEIQVYTEDMNDPGEFGLELHLNYVIEGAKTPGYEGESPSHHMLQTTPEFSYGISKNWEAGMYVPVAYEENGNLYGNGLRLRMKYMVTPAPGSALFMGFNTEIGYSNKRVSESEWGVELRPIIGVRTEKWLLSFNPILNMDLSPDFSHRAQFEPALKVSRILMEGLHAGLEYYGEYGYTNDILPASQRVNYLYAAVDIEKRDFDINFGIGWGDSNAPDSLIVKAIIAYPFK